MNGVKERAARNRRSRLQAGRVMRYWYNSRLAVIFESILIGLMVGLAITVFRLALNRADEFRQWLYGTLPNAPVYWTGLWVLVLILLGLFLGWAAKVRPMIRGCGMPQV
jgi:H+/Cl- antiporter ClcA